MKSIKIEKLLVDETSNYINDYGHSGREVCMSGSLPDGSLIHIRINKISLKAETSLNHFPEREDRTKSFKLEITEE